MRVSLGQSRHWVVSSFLKNSSYGTMYNLYAQLRDKLEAAVDNARRLSNGTNNPHTPYSRVFEVFEELMKR